MLCIIININFCHPTKIVCNIKRVNECLLLLFFLLIACVYAKHLKGELHIHYNSLFSFIYIKI